LKDYHPRIEEDTRKCYHSSSELETYCIGRILPIPIHIQKIPRPVIMMTFKARAAGEKKVLMGTFIFWLK